MIYRIAFASLYLLFSAFAGYSQNLSGLLNKKLNKVEDLGVMVESIFGRLAGKVEGNLDSIVVTQDAELELRLKIYFTGFQGIYFNVYTMGASRQREPFISMAKFNQSVSGSPVEVVLKLDPKMTKVAEFQSPYLRIDISKKEDGPGKVRIFDLRKNWKIDVPAENLILKVKMEPVGVAEKLGPTPIDVMPAKKVIFDSKDVFDKSKSPYDGTIKKSSPGNSFHGLTDNNPYLYNITGTWVNSDVNTKGLNKIIVNPTSAQVFKKCSPQDCDLGTFNISSSGTNSWTAKILVGLAKSDLNFSLEGNNLKVKHIESLTPFAKKTTEYTFQKNIQVLNQTKIFNVSEYAIADWILNPTAPVSTAALGPMATRQLNLWNEIAVDPLVDFVTSQEISNININVFGDKNEHSGIYYILPANYHVRWTEVKNPSAENRPAKGYAFRMIYGGQEAGITEPDNEAPVRFSAKLTSGITTRERSLVKAILKTLDPKFKNIRFLELKEPPISTFPSTLLAQFGVPTERITVNASSDLSNEMEIAWRTNADTKESIQTALTTREGISASVILKPKNEDIIDLQIPASINLADNRSLGKMHIEPGIWRTEYWRNTTPYPLQLKYLHVLKKAVSGNSLIIYSWSLKDLVVPSLAQVEFDHSRVPEWLDMDPTAVMWLDYGIMDCTPCDKEVLVAVTNGMFGSTTQQLKFTIAPAVYDTLNADYFMVVVRSKQADPKNEKVKELPALKIFKNATKDFITGPLLLAPGVAPDFEFQVTLATKDGEFYKSTAWIPSTEKDVMLGNRQMKEIFKGVIPGLD